MLIAQQLQLTIINMEPTGLDAASSDEEAFQNPKALVDSQQSEPEEQAGVIILEAEQQLLKRSNKSVLSEDIESKLEEIVEDIQEDDGKNFQSIITLRMKELSYCKILVLTYEKSYFKLVQAHFHIGKEYLKFKCYEQAYNHIQTAIDKNIKATENSIHKLYHSYLLTFLGECLYHTAKHEAALKELTRALNIQVECEQKDRTNVNNVQTLKYLALAKAKLRHEDTLTSLKTASERAKQFYGQSNRKYGLILYEEGKYQLNNNQIKEAVNLYKRAIEAIKMSNELDCEEDIIKLYQELANIFEVISTEEYIATLKLKYQVFEDTYGNSDKKSIKEQRNLVAALLKNKKVEESLEESEDILEKQKKVYGENSLEVGKELRTIGNIFIVKHNYKQADHHYRKAFKIFHDLGDQRLAREVKDKITSLQVHQRN